MTKSDAHSFMRAISSPKVLPLISRGRLIKSEGFLEYLSYCDAHLDLHRDVGPHERLLALFDRTQQLDVLADYLRTRHGVQVTRQDGKIKVAIPKGKVATAEPKRSLTFAQYVASPRPGASTTPKLAISKAPKNSAPSEDVWGKGYVDALDHPARLSGSYGHGKRK